jgi:hypothetical protein
LCLFLWFFYWILELTAWYVLELFLQRGMLVLSSPHSVDDTHLLNNMKEGKHGSRNNDCVPLQNLPRITIHDTDHGNEFNAWMKEICRKYFNLFSSKYNVVRYQLCLFLWFFYWILELTAWYVLELFLQRGMF